MNEPLDGAVMITEWPIENVPDDTTPVKRRKLDHSVNRVDSEEIPTIDRPDIALAKWFRRKKGNPREKMSSNELISPNTRLARLAKSEEGRQFLISQLNILNKSPDDSHVNFLKASYLDRLGLYEEAFDKVTEAIRNTKHVDGEVLWLQEKLHRQTQADTKRREIGSRLGERERRAPRIPKAVERRHVHALSCKEFFNDFALTHTPLVISGGAHSMTKHEWDFSYIKKIAGDKRVTVRRVIEDSAEWARLENSRTTTVEDFIDSLAKSHGSLKDYLFDWSLPLYCPALAEELTIPKYFSGDYLQRTAPGSLYQDSWPSLFIAPAGLHSELHIDAFGSNFWMAMFKGKKKWSFFLPEDTPLLYPTYDHSLDPTFDVQFCDVNQEKFPLFSDATVRECVLEAGDVLFVPAGCPHHVENLTDSIAISANFVGKSNFDLVKKELAAQGNIDSKARELLKQFERWTLDDADDVGDVDLPWKEFKRTQSV